MSNKIRVFVAIYVQPTGSHSPTKLSPKPLGHSQRYHWGLWLEPKGSTGEGTSFDLEDALAYSNVFSPFGWRLHIDEHKSVPPRMLGRIMIGKMVDGSAAADITSVLTQVQLPSDPESSVGDAVEWIKRVIAELQELGCAESFSIDTFMKKALSYASSWCSDKRGREPVKVNYTWSRTFP